MLYTKRILKKEKNNLKTYVCGHKNPDTDSVISAIALAEINGYEASVPGQLNKETKYVLSQFGFTVPALVPAEDKRVILVDHNSPEEMHENIKKEEIVGIVDHHKLGGPFSEEPIEVNIKPYGCTATVIAIKAIREMEKVSKQVAGILIAGIISDTLKLTSPTTTDRDVAVIKELNKIAEVDVDELAEGMFKAKSDISDIKTEDLVFADYKEFEMSGHKVGIGVWETVSPEVVMARKDEIKSCLVAEKEKSGVEAIFFATVDILKGESEMILPSEYEIVCAEKAFGTEVQGDTMELVDVVSRKKQIAPAFDRYFSNN